MRNDLKSSNLVALLGQWVSVDAQAPRTDFAERLGLWLNAFDAIELQAALPPVPVDGTAAPARVPAARSTRVDTVQAELHKVRAALAQAIARPVEPLATDPGEIGHPAYQHRQQQLQRQMEQAICALRVRVRSALGELSPRLRPLVALDAVYEKVLGTREQLLLPAIATLLEHRWGQLRSAAEGGWPEVFDREWRQALLAELDLRLEPVEGLLEALHGETQTED